MRSNRKRLESRLREMKMKSGKRLPVSDMYMTDYLETLIRLQKRDAGHLKYVMKDSIFPLYYEIRENCNLEQSYEPTFLDILNWADLSEQEERRNLLYAILILPFCDLEC